MALSNDLCDRLLALNMEAFAAESYEVAYHLLSAAMHCATDLKNAVLLDDVAQRATEQMTWIDDRAPGHPLSTRSAGTRGNRSIYGLLAMQATTHARMLAHNWEHNDG